METALLYEQLVSYSDSFDFMVVLRYKQGDRERMLPVYVHKAVLKTFCPTLLNDRHFEHIIFDNIPSKEVWDMYMDLLKSMYNLPSVDLRKHKQNLLLEVVRDMEFDMSLFMKVDRPFDHPFECKHHETTEFMSVGERLLDSSHYDLQIVVDISNVNQRIYINIHRCVIFPLLSEWKTWCEWNVLLQPSLITAFLELIQFMYLRDTCFVSNWENIARVLIELSLVKHYRKDMFDVWQNGAQCTRRWGSEKVFYNNAMQIDAKFEKRVTITKPFN